MPPHSANSSAPLAPPPALMQVLIDTPVYGHGWLVLLGFGLGVTLGGMLGEAGGGQHIEASVSERMCGPDAPGSYTHTTTPYSA